MLRKRLKNKGLLPDSPERNGLGNAYSALLQRLCQELVDPRHRVCAIASAAPGEGRSSLVLNLARVAAQEGDGAVLVLDADTVAPTLHNPLDMPPGPGMFELVHKEATLEQVVRPTNIPRVSILSCGGEAVGAVRLIEFQEFRKTLDQLRANFAWVWMDVAALSSAPAVATLCSRADGVLLAVRSGVTRVQVVNQALAKLDAAGANTLGMVLTQRHFVIPSYVYRRI